LFCYAKFSEFSLKTQIPLDLVYQNTLYVQLVWRLLEFAFFVRLLRQAHFLFCSLLHEGGQRICKANDEMQFNIETEE